MRASDPSITDTLRAGDAGDGGCYTIPMGLCYDCGFRALTVELARRLPGDYFPLGGPGGTDQQESVAGLSGHSLLTAFPLKCESLRRRPMERRASVSLWPACPVTVSQRRVAIEVAGLAVCGGALRRHKLTDEQVPLPLSALIQALPPEQGTIGPYHRPEITEMTRCCKHHVKSAFYGTLWQVVFRTLPAPVWVSTRWIGGRSGHGGQ